MTALDLDTLPMRLRDMITALITNAAVINTYSSGSLELHFTRDERQRESVSLKLREIVLSK